MNDDGDQMLHNSEIFIDSHADIFKHKIIVKYLELEGIFLL